LRIKFTIGAVLTLAGTLWAQPPEQSETIFRSETRLVVLHASPEDKDGHLVKSLPASAFQVFENGVKQKISGFRQEDVPVSLGLVIDSSASMSKKRDRVAAAALALVRLSNPTTRFLSSTLTKLRRSTSITPTTSKSLRRA
jgi:VWFA-related protein